MIMERPEWLPVIAAVSTRLKRIESQATNSPGFGKDSIKDAASDLLQAAVKLAKKARISAQEMSLCFSAAFQRATICVKQDAWFENGFRYAEVEFCITGIGPIAASWGKLLRDDELCLPPIR